MDTGSSGTTDGEWPSSFATTQSALRTTMALLARHPYLPIENLHYNRNFVNIIGGSLEMMDLLGGAAHPPLVGLCARMVAHYTEVEDSSYDENKLATLRSELLRSTKALTDTGLPLVSLVTDVSELKAHATRTASGDSSREVDRLFGHWCRLTPLLYDHDGNALANGALASLPSVLDRLTPPELADRYQDYFSQHLAPLLIECANRPGLGAVHRITRNVLNQFIPRVVEPAVQRYASHRQQVARRTITLEEVPPVFAALRGALAGDCSMVSVPYYGVLRACRTYWIRKREDFSTKPVGYAILALIEHAGAPVPYVLTINGPTLAKGDVLAVLRAIGQHHGSGHLFLPDLDVNEYYVNTPAIRDAFGTWRGATCDVSLPTGWTTVDESPTGVFEKYYRHDCARHARLIALSPPTSEFFFRPLQPVFAYPPPVDVRSAAALNRALTCYYYERSGASDSQCAEARTLLGLNDELTDAITVLVRLYRERVLSIEGFDKLHRHFDFGLRELGRLEIDIRGGILRALYDAFFDRFPLRDWVDLVVDTNRELDGLLTNRDTDVRRDTDDLKDMKVSMPDVFLSNYWADVRPHLFLPNGYASAYHCQRFVKSFHSVGTIDAFLDFLLEFPYLLKSLDTEYRRWSDFFARARKHLGDDERVERAMELAYLQHLRDPATQGGHHLARTLLEYEHALGQPQLALRSEVRDRLVSQALETDDFDRRFETEASESS